MIDFLFTIEIVQMKNNVVRYTYHTVSRTEALYLVFSSCKLTYFPSVKWKLRCKNRHWCLLEA